MDLVTDDNLSVISGVTDVSSPVLEEMTEYAHEEEFPIVGPQSGQFLRTIAAATGARHVFEFGSGFGYSAAWYANVLPDSSEIVLTDYDNENLARAKEFFERIEFAGDVHYEDGDAMESFTRHDGPWDLVLIDHAKSQYADALSIARSELSENAVIVADNILRGPASQDDIRAALQGAAVDFNESTTGIIEYIRTVRDDDAFETSIVPIGSGLAISAYRP
ncbi:putative O-methyltransferase YrrM [Halorubrum trapanicum]|uniref:Putative O-methyltransferase YrrM n=1 Tax=Halorubrum trapanicum TaxID=29284 RepID=A0A8J7R9L2_9EURY|nr:O-methyltransferase [Halorubrum trapanicum]MBP1902834.1 putative O-methyltransferase YrrM [Halorubrum trapanicum]